MGHVIANLSKLTNRIRRLRGQLAALERSFASGDCNESLRLMSTVRGATNALHGEMLVEYIKEHALDEGGLATAVREFIS